jgi:hypothetical protein
LTTSDTERLRSNPHVFIAALKITSSGASQEGDLGTDKLRPFTPGAGSLPQMRRLPSQDKFEGLAVEGSMVKGFWNFGILFIAMA